MADLSLPFTRSQFDATICIGRLAPPAPYLVRYCALPHCTFTYFGFHHNDRQYSCSTAYGSILVSGASFAGRIP